MKKITIVYQDHILSAARAIIEFTKDVSRETFMQSDQVFGNATSRALLFFKQWGAWGEDSIKRSKKANGRVFLGREWNEEPPAVQAV